MKILCTPKYGKLPVAFFMEVKLRSYVQHYLGYGNMRELWRKLHHGGILDL
jgi:hypothetical protein